MKWIAIILTSWIILLTVLPVSAEIYSVLTQETEGGCHKDCCKQEPVDQSKELPDRQTSGNCCSNGLCIPFEQCCCCIGLIGNQQPIPTLTPISLNHPIPVSDNSISNDAGDYFRPPEII